MRKTLSASLILLALSASTLAGYCPSVQQIGKDSGYWASNASGIHWKSAEPRQADTINTMTLATARKEYPSASNYASIACGYTDSAGNLVVLSMTNPSSSGYTVLLKPAGNWTQSILPSVASCNGSDPQDCPYI